MGKWKRTITETTGIATIGERVPVSMVLIRNGFIVRTGNGGKSMRILKNSDATIKVIPEYTTDKQLRVRVEKNGRKDNYFYYGDGNDVFPLKYGSGKYTVTLYKQHIGDICNKVTSVTFTVKQDPDKKWMLEPNQYAPWTSDSQIVAKATELYNDAGTEDKYIDSLKKWVTRRTVYDYLRAVRVRKGKEPPIDPERCFRTHIGICGDIASMTVIMLRSQGIPATFVLGKVKGGDHAWVKIYAKSGTVIFDPTAVVLNQGIASTEYKQTAEY